MAERYSWAVDDLIGVEDARLALGALVSPGSSQIQAQTGIKPATGDPGKVDAQVTPDATVRVFRFQAFLQCSRGAVEGGVFVLTLDSTKTVDILGANPAHTSLARNDLIIAHQAEAGYGDADSDMTVLQVVGTPAATPADPSLAAYPDHILLARVRVEPNATAITDDKITDLRPGHVVAVGGLKPVASQSERDALLTYNGMAIWRTDRAWVEIFQGSTWRVQGIAIVATQSDLSAITNPASGQPAWVNGEGQHYVYFSGAWRRMDWNSAWGVIGGQRYSSTGASLATGVPAGEWVTNMSTGTVSVVAGRRYRVVTKLKVTASAGGAVARVSIRENTVGGTKRAADMFTPDLLVSVGYQAEFAAEYNETSTRTLTFVSTIGLFSGTGTLTLNRAAAGDEPLYFTVHDCGPSTAVATV